jgi:prepilin-type N-terminal cleavage/methylation domain-containing protein/prepilin-type processing-associated H-X9-DG protein
VLKEKTMSNHTRRTTGFTLIELLVVIAIIAILAAILFPVFARARENARRASCQSNLKQVALGVFQYKQDYDEKLPVVAYANGTGAASSPYGWADSLQPYLKSTQIYQCPSETTAPQANPISNGYTDYWINASAAGLADASFASSSLTVLLGDGDGTTPGDANYGSTSRYAIQAGVQIEGVTTPASCTIPLTTPTNAITDKGASRHLDGGNYAFADGHVKWYKASTSGGTTIAAIANGCSPTTILGGAFAATFSPK